MSLRAPFDGLKASKVADRFPYLLAKLHDEGRVRARYSVHDLRHAFAVRPYTERKDIYAVEKALRHASVGVTGGYLRSLGLER